MTMTCEITPHFMLLFLIAQLHTNASAHLSAKLVHFSMAAFHLGLSSSNTQLHTNAGAHPWNLATFPGFMAAFHPCTRQLVVISQLLITIYTGLEQAHFQLLLSLCTTAPFYITILL